MVVGPNARIVFRARFQFLEGTPFEILHATHCRVNLAIDKIPPVAHTEHIGAFVETVPHHSHENALVRPVGEVRGCELCQHAFAVGLCGYKHMVYAIVRSEDTGVAEVVRRIAVIAPAQDESTALGPCLEIRGSRHLHYLAAVVGLQQFVAVSRVETVVQPFAIDKAACTYGSVLLVDTAAGDEFVQRCIVRHIRRLHTPDRMVSAHSVGTIVLQVAYLEGLAHGVVKRHYIAYIPDRWTIVGIGRGLIGRRKEIGGMLPIALGDGGDTLLATCGKDGAKRQEEKPTQALRTPSNSPYKGGEFG